MNARNPEREIKLQTDWLGAINTLLSVERIRDSAAAGPLTQFRDDIEAAFEKDCAAADRYRRLYLGSSGPLADLRGVESRTLGRALRAAMEEIEEDGE